MKNSIILGKKDVFCIEAELRQMQEYILSITAYGVKVNDRMITL